MSVATAFSAEAVQDVVDPALERRRAALSSSPSSDDDHSAVRGDVCRPPAFFACVWRLFAVVP